MDALDRQIIGEVVADGRITLQELAERVHLSPSSARERLRRLEAGGAIAGYHASIDESVLGFPLEALVEVDLAPGADGADFEAGLRARPAVVEALHATGDHDYLLRLRCADADELHHSVRGLKSELGAKRTVTRLVLDRPVALRQRQR